MNKEYDLHLPLKTELRDGNNPVFPRIKEEHLFRLNPHWIVKTFSCSDSSYSIEIVDHETEVSKTLAGRYIINAEGFPELSADGNEWLSIRFFLKEGSLHADVTYREEPEEDVERKMVLWLRAVKEYLRLYSENTLNTRFFKMLMNRVILPMTPSQRKISLMLIRITILELLIIVVILVGWFFFFR